MKLLFAVAAAALLAAPAAAQDRMTLILDWFVNPDHAPIVLAEELGYFEEAGLEVEVITPADPNDPPRMVAAGRAELAVSYQPQLHLHLHEDMPLIRVGTLVASPLTCLVVLADGPVETIADLEGRRVGYAVAGVQEALLTGMLNHHGLDVSDVERINIGWSISPALMAGQIDAVIGAYRNFELNQLMLEGMEGRCFNPEEEGVPIYDELIYVANPDTMDVELIARFLDATARATAYIFENPEESWELFAGTATELQTELNRLAWHDTWELFPLDPAASDSARYDAFEAFLHELGVIPSVNPAERLTVDVTAP